MEYLGNKTLLNEFKVGFLCSKKIPASVVLKSYEWAKEEREKGVCVVIGNHSQIEKDVFQILLKGKQPLILVLARGMLNRIDLEMKQEIESGRLLLVVPFEKSVKRVTSETAERRNGYIAEMCDTLVVGYISNNGMLDRILKEKNTNYNLIETL